MLRIHPRDQAAFSAFLDREWDESPQAAIDYRLNLGSAGDWLRVRHTASFSERDGEGILSGLVEELSSPQLTRTLLERTEEEIREGEAKLSGFIREILEIRAGDQLAPLLERVRVALRADVVALARGKAETESPLPPAATVGGMPLDPEAIAAALESALRGGGSQGEDGWVEFDLEPEAPRPRYFAAHPLPHAEDAPPVALCAGFGTAMARAAAKRFSALLALAADRVGHGLQGNREAPQRQDLLAHLRQAQRFSSFGRLAGGFAHELKNLLTLVEGHLHLVEDSLAKGDREAGEESLRQIRRAAEEAAACSDRLLGFDFSGEPELRPCDLNRIVERFASMMRRILEESVSLRLDLDPRISQTRADENLLREALLNLLVNTRDSMPRGGAVTISTRSAVGLRGSASSYICLRIGERDPASGPGRSVKEDEARDSAPGAPGAPGELGLELYHVATVVSEHGGRIETFTTPEGWRGFEILLPAADTREERRERSNGAFHPGAQPQDHPCLRDATVLLVEDEAAVRKLARKLLERIGCRVVEAASGREALEIWPEVRERISLVVSDVVMPEGVSGWDLARELNQASPRLGILLTSGYSDRPEDHGLGGIGRISYLQKPYRADDLRQSLARLAEPGAA